MQTKIWASDWWGVESNDICRELSIEDGCTVSVRIRLRDDSSYSGQLLMELFKPDGSKSCEIIYDSTEVTADEAIQVAIQDGKRYAAALKLR